MQIPNILAVAVVGASTVSGSVHHKTAIKRRPSQADVDVDQGYGVEYTMLPPVEEKAGDVYFRSFGDAWPVPSVSDGLDYSWNPQGSNNTGMDGLDYSWNPQGGNDTEISDKVTTSSLFGAKSNKAIPNELDATTTNPFEGQNVDNYFSVDSNVNFTMPHSITGHAYQYPTFNYDSVVYSDVNKTKYSDTNPRRFGDMVASNIFVYPPSEHVAAKPNTLSPVSTRVRRTQQ